jgi:hypothetical protein
MKQTRERHSMISRSFSSELRLIHWKCDRLISNFAQKSGIRGATIAISRHLHDDRRRYINTSSLFLPFSSCISFFFSNGKEVYFSLFVGRLARNREWGRRELLSRNASDVGTLRSHGSHPGRRQSMSRQGSDIDECDICDRCLFCRI